MIKIFSIFSWTAFAQTDSKKSPLSFSGYLDTYCCYDFANPVIHIKQPFHYAYNHHHEVNLNLGFVKKGSNFYKAWYSPLLVLRIIHLSKFSIAAIGEYYREVSGLIIASGTPNNFQTFGFLKL